MTTIEKRKVEMAEMKAAMAKKQEELKAEMAKMKAEAKELAEKAKKEEAKLKAKEAKEEAKDWAERMKLVFKPKMNMTEHIRQLMMEAKTKEQIVEETGYSAKAVTDRMWLIIKDLEKKEKEMAK